MATKITVLISGSGTNLQALIDASARGELAGGVITRVISSSPTAYGLERAAKASIPTLVHSLQSDKYYGKVPKTDKVARKAAREQFNGDLAEIVLSEPTDLVVCAGWMLILSPRFLEPLGKVGTPIINLHPALPGAFAGINAIQRAWEAGQKGEIAKAGVMIHKVILEVDEGEPLLVKELDLRKDETVEAYEQRVHDIEHIAIVEGTVKAISELCGH